MEQLRKRNSRKSLVPLTQIEIIRNINKSTQNSYKYFGLLNWKGN